MNHWIILDRDGVINLDSKDYIKSPKEWIPLPMSLEAIKLMNDKGYRVAVATNQSGVFRSYFTEDTLHQIHEKMLTQLNALRGNIEKIVYCPHGPDEGCECRKPNPGLLLKIASSFGFDLSKAYYVGDSFKDVQAAIACDCRPVLVKTGNGIKTLQNHPVETAHIPIFENLHSFALSLPFV